MCDYQFPEFAKVSTGIHGYCRVSPREHNASDTKGYTVISLALIICNYKSLQVSSGTLGYCVVSPSDPSTPDTLRYSFIPLVPIMCDYLSLQVSLSTSGHCSVYPCNSTTSDTTGYSFISFAPIICNYPVADPAAGRWGDKKHEIYAATLGGHLFMTNFYRTGGGGGMAPLIPPSPDPLLLSVFSSQLRSPRVRSFSPCEPCVPVWLQEGNVSLTLILSG